ncbi:hypothetical protein CHLRE_05g244052v5 [Chlamydomonas reinhardtii]|uniref:Uncharacterized protein n=1 Tax=Chlamydomonas reinhardtii TaxID=3055 RepID=A0A2K3DS98_CHLRE|nr:uncharacterized protein CHLRE_05g244052v5 [Chlamydomonas reinhardtii]PNW83414.1 hypothetical protein CHLRE_05g244052v5 [Chlamydomonas reinhardtii]
MATRAGSRARRRRSSSEGGSRRRGRGRGAGAAAGAVGAATINGSAAGGPFTASNKLLMGFGHGARGVAPQRHSNSRPRSSPGSSNNISSNSGGRGGRRRRSAELSSARRVPMASRPLPLPSPVRGPRSALPGAKPPRGASGAQEGNGTKAKQAKPEQLFCWTRRDVGQFGRCGCAWWQARRALLLGVALAAGLLMWEAVRAGPAAVAAASRWGLWGP